MNMKFQDLLKPVGKEIFFEKYWQLKPLNINSIDGFDTILDIQDLNDYLTKANLIYPFLRMVGNGDELKLDSYSAQHNYLNVLNRDKIFKLFEDGNTIIIQGAQYLFEGLKKFQQDISNELKSTANINIYITPRESQGFHPHFDAHEVFVLQLFGEKRWRLYDQNTKFPLKGWALTEVATNQYFNQTPSNEIIMTPGDFLYFPAGVVHDAYCEDELSIHLTIGVNSKTNVDFLKHLVSISENIEFFRTPFNKDEQTIKLLQQNLKQLIETNYSSFNSYSPQNLNETNKDLFLDFCCADNLKNLYSDDLKAVPEKAINLNEMEQILIDELSKAKNERSESYDLLTNNSFNKKIIKSLLRKGAIKLNH